MSLWLGACAALTEIPSSVPSTHFSSSQLPVTLAPGIPTPSCILYRYPPQVADIHRYIHTNN